MPSAIHMPNLIVLAGVPGCGKSTWARLLFDLKYAIVSSDEIRKELAGSLKDAHGNDIRPWDVFYQRIEDYLRHSVDVIADATFLTPRHRTRARELAEKTGAALHLVLFDNWWEAHERNEARDADNKVPPNVMEDMMKLYWDTLATLPMETYTSITTIKGVE